MSTPAIRVDNLSKRYVISHQASGNRSFKQSVTDTLAKWSGNATTESCTTASHEEFWALRDLNFEIYPGETVAIVGANGAGKSTLLKILSRVTAPTTGKVLINGRVASLLEVGTGFHPELSGRENIFLNGAILGMSRDEIRRKFDTIVGFAEVEEFIDTPVKRYSSGMYTRLAFAVAAHLDCEILIIDEVLSVGDAAFQAKSLAKMTQIMEAGKTILFVSHNMAAAQKLCQSAIHLEKGRIKAKGSCYDVISGYMRSTSNPSEFCTDRRHQYVPGLTITHGQLLRNDESTREFSPSDTITIRLQIDITTPRLFNVEFVIRDQQGLPALFIPSGLIQDVQFGQRAGRITVEAQIKDLLLASGSYSLDAILCQSGVCFYERIENALNFTIQPHAMGPQNHHLRQSDGFGNLIVRADFRQIA